MQTLFEMEPLDESGVKLNEAQWRAVMHSEGPLLVIAGAGTGKTRVITERIRQLLHTNPELSGENILGLTFTRKAAGEMKARVVKATGERGKAVTLATFHSFCETLLKDVDPERVVLDTVDHWILLRRNLARLKLEQYRRLAEPGQFLNDFVEFFSRCQDELVPAEDYQRYADLLASELESERGMLDAETLAEREELVAREQEIARAYRASEELLREKKRVSFGSLITGAVALLETDAALRESLRQRFRYILVDEFQDTNIAQLRLLELLAGDARNIFAVGDNDQAIYRFRGASFRSLQLFPETLTARNRASHRARRPPTCTRPSVLRTPRHRRTRDTRSPHPPLLTPSHAPTTPTNSSRSASVSASNMPRSDSSSLASRSAYRW